MRFDGLVSRLGSARWRGGVTNASPAAAPPTPTVAERLSDGALRGVRSAKLDERESEEKRDELRR